VLARANGTPPVKCFGDGVQLGLDSLDRAKLVESGHVERDKAQRQRILGITVRYSKAVQNRIHETAMSAQSEFRRRLIGANRSGREGKAEQEMKKVQQGRAVAIAELPVNRAPPTIALIDQVPGHEIAVVEGRRHLVGTPN
jgi:hypothetical protein